MALYEQLTVEDLYQKEFGRGTVKFQSIFPDTLHLLANWAMAIDNRVFLGAGITNQEASNPTIPFGNVEMYPWPFRNSQSLDYVSIMPTIVPSGQVSSDGRQYATANYCYAIEIILEKTTSPSGEFTGYEGRGGFTMAYNPNADMIPYYNAGPFIPYPLFIYKNSNDQYENSLPVYLTASLTPDEENLDGFVLKFYINSFDKKLYFPVFEYLIEIGNRDSFANKKEEGGISGMVDISTNLSNNPSVFAIKDIQIITPKIELEATSDVSIPERRCEFISTYAFPSCDILTDVILSSEDASVDLNRYIFTGPYVGSSINRIIALPQDSTNSLNQPTNSSPRSYSQPVQVTLKITCEPIYTIRMIRQYDNTGRFIATLTGDVYVKFPGKYTATFFADGNIDWKYTETTSVTNNGLSFSQYYDLTGKMMATTAPVQSLFPASETETLSVLIDNLKHSPLLNGAVRIPTDEEFETFKQSKLQEFNDINLGLGILVPYILYKPNTNVINAQYNEILFIHGFYGASEELRNFLDISPDSSNQLVISDRIMRISNTIQTNRALRVPIALVGRATQSTYLSDWSSNIQIRTRPLGVELLV